MEKVVTEQERRDELQKTAYAIVLAAQERINEFIKQINNGEVTPEEFFTNITGVGINGINTVPRAESYMDPQHLAWCKEQDERLANGADFVGIFEEALARTAPEREANFVLTARTIEVAINITENGRVSYDFHAFSVHCFGHLMLTEIVVEREVAEKEFRKEFGNLDTYEIRYFWPTC